jgi:hypothetical protein
MFVEVDIKDLVVDKKYLILTKHCHFNRNYRTGTFKRHEILYGTKLNAILNYSKLHEGVHSKRNYKNDCAFFEFVPQKQRIQQDMEQRALNQILKRIVNDDFTW